jgi:hypothetical protein
VNSVDGPGGGGIYRYEQCGAGLTPEGITPSSDVGRGRIGGGAPRIWNAMIHRYTLVRERRLRAILPNIIEHRWRSRPPNRWATYVHTICYKRQAGGERCTRVPVVQLRSRPPCPSCWEWWSLSSHKHVGGDTTGAAAWQGRWCAGMMKKRMENAIRPNPVCV